MKLMFVTPPVSSQKFVDLDLYFPRKAKKTLIFQLFFNGDSNLLDNWCWSFLVGHPVVIILNFLPKNKWSMSRH